MATQRTTEWLDTSRKEDAAYLSYHERQHQQLFRSTIALCKWLESFGLLTPTSNAAVADIACGMGANTMYMARRFPRATFVGIDLDPILIDRGREHLSRTPQANCRFMQGDLYHLDHRHIGQYDGITHLQTLSWLPDYETPLRQFFSLQPKWVAVSSLFFDGPVNCRIEIQDYTCPVGGKPYREAFYNTYAMPLIRRCALEAGYRKFDAVPFEIDIDMPKPQVPGLGTYTVKTEEGHRLQLTGPLLMSWHFVLMRR